jgi:hypothetical protein
MPDRESNPGLWGLHFGKELFEQLQMAIRKIYMSSRQ